MVMANGNVIISWSIPADPLHEFQSYEVYSSSFGAAGPYSLTSSITTSTTASYQTVGFNANAQQYYFYVQVKNTSNQLMPAIDTVKTIFLSMNSPANSSIASFQWDDFHFPLPSGESASYNIFREYPINNWTQIGTMAVHGINTPYHYNDTISVCYDSINYRVELFDPLLSCTSVSNVKGNWFKDKTAPQAPRLDSVSVDVNGNVVMGIHPSSSADAVCYVVYHWTGGTYVPIDTPCTGNTPTIYTFTNSTANSSSEEFSVAAIDSCGNISVIALNDQATIYLHATYDICSKTASLTWNPYKNMASSVNHYEVLCSLNGGAFTHVADTTTLVYFHHNLVQGATYCYRIRAHSTLKNIAQQDSVTSTSNKFCINTAAANAPGYVYLSNVTIDNPSEIVTVTWHVDSTVKVGGFTIYRANNHNGPFSYVGSAGPVALQSDYSFTDNSANAAAQKYFYYVRVLDTCNNPIMKTDTSNTILLTAAASGNFKATLNWDNYAIWLGGVASYNIYRSLDGVFAGGPIANVPVGTNTYVDDLSNYTTHQGKFTYYVEAVEGTGNPYSLLEKSQSNLADIYLDAMMFVPNAFVPKGHNKIFLPIGDYIEKTEYKLTIYNRWGDKIFQTTDENEGWDGGQNTEGLYGYVIEYKNAMGEYRQQQGTVTLVR